MNESPSSPRGLTECRERFGKQQPETRQPEAAELASSVHFARHGSDPVGWHSAAEPKEFEAPLSRPVGRSREKAAGLTPGSSTHSIV